MTTKSIYSEYPTAFWSAIFVESERFQRLRRVQLFLKRLLNKQIPAQSQQ